MSAQTRGIIVGCVLIAGLGVVAGGDAVPPVEWASQFGTPAYEQGRHLAVGGDVAYIVGRTAGSLAAPDPGGEDMFLRAYDLTGNVLWTRQLGTPAMDGLFAAAAFPSGGTIVTGYTAGNLVAPSAGGPDVFAARYDAGGNQLWAVQIGTAASDYSYGVSTTATGDVYMAGFTEGSLGGPNLGGRDIFLGKLDSAGNTLWTRQIGTTGSDYSCHAATDSLGNCYVAATTYGSLGGTNLGSGDALLLKYNTQGTLEWARQIGTPGTEEGWAVAVDCLDNIILTGVTQGSLAIPNAGAGDVFLAKYRPNGDQAWVRQFGTSSWEYAHGLVADSAGNVYVTGYTHGSLAASNAGDDDLFIRKYDAAGNVLWTWQRGTGGQDWGLGVALDADERLFVAGMAGGDLFGPSAGSNDAFLLVLTPEPCSFLLLALGLPALAAMRRRSRT